MMIAENLRRVEERIGVACRAAGRVRSEVAVVAVCKTFPVESVREAAAAGLTDFGENRFQEAETKIAELRGQPMNWHFLGQIQTNKLNRILECFSMVQSFDRLEVLEKAEKLLAARGAKCDGLIEVQISGEISKAGFEISELEELISSVDWSRFKYLKIRGLMGIGPNTDDRALIRRSFNRLKNLFEEGKAAGLPWDTLSMGMSADLEEAIAAGSTMVRIGSAIFGTRPTSAAERM
jgi:hypothetical protein